MLPAKTNSDKERKGGKRDDGGGHGYLNGLDASPASTSPASCCCCYSCCRQIPVADVSLANPCSGYTVAVRYPCRHTRKGVGAGSPVQIQGVAGDAGSLGGFLAPACTREWRAVLLGSLCMLLSLL